VKKLFMAASAVAALACGTANAQSFGVDDVDRIVEVSRNNDLKFARDYKGKIFTANVAYKKIVESTFGVGYTVYFDVGWCSGVVDKAVLDRVVDWDTGRMVRLRGLIDSTFMGNMTLEHCTFADN
jgi:hypothetical protein